MEISTQAILDGIISMMEQTVLPELTTKYTRGQAMAGIVLLKELATRLAALEEVQFEELDLLRTSFEEIAHRLEEVTDLEEDKTLIQLRDKIREALLGGGLQKEIGILDALLEETIVALAEAEKRHHGKALEILQQIRKIIRRDLKKQFEIRTRLSNALEMKQLSKAQ